MHPEDLVAREQRLADERPYAHRHSTSGASASISAVDLLEALGLEHRQAGGARGGRDRGGLDVPAAPARAGGRVITSAGSSPDASSTSSAKREVPM